MAEIGVIGGSGFYSFLTGARPVEVETPFGPPSQPPVVGLVNGREVAFIPRHGADHRLPPHRVNYRANLWALRHLGVRQVLGPCAVGSLRASLTPGTMLVPDQYVDRTWGREHTVYDGLGGGSGVAAPVVHVSVADPYCAAGRAAVLAAGNGSVVAEGTMVVINGPRFSTRAESRWHAAQGWSVVGMTGAPEASLARELALCYTSVAVVTDHDAGVEAGGGVTQAEVFEVFGRSIERLKGLLTEVIGQLPKPDEDCSCRHALDGTDGEDLW
ncbi:S-methyl-5'-thioadenosine phosphorylase [Streptomyces sp. SID13031]|uniref:S-methyl-5'-thioadenosine phosphorylase n=1 Tax=Streptomyces sp. SID13031 TaxID=2706046 RepID=UPI0013CA3C7F|nr:S-methyl-5'-thioadenosine phosphorylase [Streptomyces sp. SID13031]NEA30306.1 S-methyl-5'-thioadenosine phosphorylase [Streptomyces sp. SID13031]